MLFLSRSPDPGSQFWEIQLQQGVPDQLVIAGILASQEFYGDSA